MLADAKRLKADLIGQHRFLDHVAKHLTGRVNGAVGRRGNVAKGIDPELE